MDLLKQERMLKEKAEREQGKENIFNERMEENIFIVEDEKDENI